MFLNEYILSYENIIKKLDELCQIYNNIITKNEPIGYTCFNFPISYYTIR